jgi:hypothetical protein
MSQNKISSTSSLIMENSKDSIIYIKNSEESTPLSRENKVANIQVFATS